VDPSAGLDDLEKRKFLTLPGIELRPPSRYIDCASPAPVTEGYLYEFERKEHQADAVCRNRDVSGEVKWGKTYNLLYAQRAKERGTVPTDISITANIGLCIGEDDVSTARPICPNFERQERVVKSREKS
jgi:hypothetical protein